MRNDLLEMYLKHPKELYKILKEQGFLYRSLLNIDSNITFGTEIEYRYADYNRVSEVVKKTFGDAKTLYSNWQNTYDNTVSQHYKTISGEVLLGGEVISPILTDNENNWKDLEKALNIIINLNGIVDENCGGHIHIGANILENNKEYLINFLCLWSIFEPVIFRYAYGYKDYMHKSINSHTPLSDYIYYSYTELKNSEFEEIAGKMVDFPTFSSPVSFDWMYEYKNTSHMEKRKNTIEFRIPNGTLCKYLWQNNINFFVRLLNLSKNVDTNYLEHLLRNKFFGNVFEYNYVRLEDALILSDLVFAKEIDKLLFLKQYLKAYKKEEREKDKIKSLIK